MELFKDMTAKNVRNYSLFIFIIPKLFQIFFYFFFFFSHFSSFW